MTDEVMVAKITEHDRHLDALSSAIEHLVATAATTNLKLDKMVDVLSAQNVIKERLNNLEENLKESFERVHSRRDSTNGRLGKVEDIIDSVPTPATIRWGVGILIAYTFVSGNYIVSHLHTLESDTFASKQTHGLHLAGVQERLNKLEESYEK